MPALNILNICFEKPLPDPPTELELKRIKEKENGDIELRKIIKKENRDHIYDSTPSSSSSVWGDLSGN